MTTNSIQSLSFASRVKSVFTAWLKDPAEVASIFPSSRQLTDCVADRQCVRKASLVVDLGPGTGGTTLALLRQMRADGKLVAIETNKSFIGPLNKIDDSRLSVINGDAANLNEHLSNLGLESPDVIVSGIPYSSLDPEVAHRIARSIYNALTTGGQFIAYQLRSDVLSYASPLLGEPVVETVRWNVPPLKVYRWLKSRPDNANCHPPAPDCQPSELVQ